MSSVNFDFSQKQNNSKGVVQHNITVLKQLSNVVRQRNNLLRQQQIQQVQAQLSQQMEQEQAQLRQQMEQEQAQLRQQMEQEQAQAQLRQPKQTNNGFKFGKLV